MTDPITIHTEGLTKHYGDVRALVTWISTSKPAKSSDSSVRTAPARPPRSARCSMRSGPRRVRLDPRDGYAHPSVEIRRHIGYVPGDLAMYPNLTGKDTLTYFANLRGGVDWDFVDHWPNVSTPISPRRSATSPQETGRRSASSRPS